MLAAAEQVAFASPAGELAAPSRGRPIDLIHLARQSCGDKALETEILTLFRQQLGLAADQLHAAKGRERTIIAHTIKGSARAVGAFGLSRIAGRIEDMPHDRTLLVELEQEVARIRDFIAALNR